MKIPRAARLAPVLLTTALAAALLLPSSALAGKAPSLASTAQYKAFGEYVKKLDALVGQPTSTAQKGVYESELTTKKEAATHKANALFNRSSDEAAASSEAKFKEQAEAIRGGEAADLEQLGAEFGAKRARAEASYHAKLEKLADGRRKFEARLHEQIESLRARKAQTADVAGKNAIQEQIDRLAGEIAARRSTESAKRAQLKAGFGKQKEVIHAAEAKREGEIQAAAEAKIATSSKHWKSVAGAKKSSLDAKRESQLAYLEAKLEKGRADIATMPASS